MTMIEPTIEDNVIAYVEDGMIEIWSCSKERTVLKVDANDAALAVPALGEFFGLHGIRDIQAASSVDFAHEYGADTAKVAGILRDALNWS